MVNSRYINNYSTSKYYLILTNRQLPPAWYTLTSAISKLFELTFGFRKRNSIIKQYFQLAFCIMRTQHLSPIQNIQIRDAKLTAEVRTLHM